MNDENLQRLKRLYQQETGKKQITTHEMAEWAVENQKYEFKPTRSAVVARCAEEFARAMRNETFFDEQGREVRLMHAVTEKKGQQNFTFWESMKSASPQFMLLSFQQRRMGILASVRKLYTDKNSYNENVNPGQQIEIVFNFTNDLLEMEEVARSA